MQILGVFPLVIAMEYELEVHKCPILTVVQTEVKIYGNTFGTRLCARYWDGASNHLQQVTPRDI